MVRYNFHPGPNEASLKVGGVHSIIYGGRQPSPLQGEGLLLLTCVKAGQVETFLSGRAMSVPREVFQVFEGGRARKFFHLSFLLRHVGLHRNYAFEDMRVCRIMCLKAVHSFGNSGDIAGRKIMHLVIKTRALFQQFG